MRRDRGHRGDHSEPLGVTIRWGGLGGLVECYFEVAPALALGAAVSGFFLDDVVCWGTRAGAACVLQM